MRAAPAMGKTSKGSRKRKKAWRANVSNDDIDDFFEKQTHDAHAGAAAIPSLPSDSLFYVDKPAASTSAASASDTSKDIPAKRNIEKREEVLYNESLLKDNPYVQPIPSSVVKKAKMEFQDTQGEKNVPMEDDSAEKNIDIWTGNGDGGTKAKKLQRSQKFFSDADDGDEDVPDDDGDQDADTLVGQSIVNTKMPSVAEAAARKARIEHSSATVTILVSRKKAGARKTAVGSGFVVKLDKINGRCKVMTCEHVLGRFIDKSHKYHLWVRYFRGDEDALATVQFACDHMDIAVLDAPHFPARPGTTPPTILEFSKKKKIGTDIVLLGYFNPPAIEQHFGKESVIAKDPNSIPGKITGPLRYYPNVPDKVTFPHSCYGIDESSGSPIISHESGKVLGIFHSSDDEIHSAIATIAVKNQLILWLRAEGTTSMKDLIERL